MASVYTLVTTCTDQPQSVHWWWEWGECWAVSPTVHVVAVDKLGLESSNADWLILAVTVHPCLWLLPFNVGGPKPELRRPMMLETVWTFNYHTILATITTRLSVYPFGAWLTVCKYMTYSTYWCLTVIMWDALFVWIEVPSVWCDICVTNYAKTCSFFVASLEWFVFLLFGLSPSRTIVYRCHLYATTSIDRYALFLSSRGEYLSSFNPIHSPLAAIFCRLWFLIEISIYSHYAHLTRWNYEPALSTEVAGDENSNTLHIALA